jgi:hypothetical protein
MYACASASGDPRVPIFTIGASTAARTTTRDRVPARTALALAHAVFPRVINRALFGTTHARAPIVIVDIVYPIYLASVV